MKLKYQMRGLGIGMIVTALLMGVAGERVVPLSDAEIRAKALALGMVESDSLKLTDVSNASPVPSETHPTGQDGMPESGSEDGERTDQEEEDREESAEQSGESRETGAQAENPEESPAVSPTPEEVSSPEDGDKVTVVIESGVTSYRICIMLAELGLVEDAAEFDTYLCDNGYSRKINYGTYEIPMGASEEEIAKIITRNR